LRDPVYILLAVIKQPKTWIVSKLLRELRHLVQGFLKRFRDPIRVVYL